MTVKLTLRYAAVMVASLALPAAALAQTPTTTTPVTPPAPGVIAPGVSIAGVDVSGLSRADAVAKVTAEAIAPRQAPLPIVIRGLRSTVTPSRVGYTALVDRAVLGALNVGRTQPPGPVEIPVTQKVNLRKLRSSLAWHARASRIAPRDTAVHYADGRVVITRSRVGVDLDLAAATTQVQRAITSGAREALTLPLTRVAPAVVRVPTTVFIDRGRFRLVVVRSSGIRTFPVAVGMPAYPTPTGTFHIVQKQRNPTWYPPDSRWAAGLGPVPPGIGNPLGTRWMGLSAPGVGIHGTPASYSIGSRASHGCIRMYIRDAERVYDMVEVGTPVTIV
ncbi:MAG: L,D-transpeptidase family protein [Thermoleophilia bacterium]